MISISFSELTQLFGHIWWPFMRCTGFVLIAPILGDKLIPMRFRLLVAFLIAIIISPMLKDVPAMNPFSIEMILYSTYQMIFGFALGFAFLLFMTIFTMAGEAISMQMGLSMAMMNDPINGVSIPIIGRLFMVLSSLLFLSMDGHLVVINTLTDSFRYWPLMGSFPFDNIYHVLEMVTWLFTSALIIAVPAIIVMLLSNTTFGFMSRAAPALNIFALGFPMTMLLGLFALLLSVAGVGDVYLNFVLEMNEHMQYMLRLNS